MSLEDTLSDFSHIFLFKEKTCLWVKVEGVEPGAHHVFGRHVE
jgi:hypothetical protein